MDKNKVRQILEYLSEKDFEFPDLPVMVPHLRNDLELSEGETTVYLRYLYEKKCIIVYSDLRAFLNVGFLLQKNTTTIDEKELDDLFLKISTEGRDYLLNLGKDSKSKVSISQNIHQPVGSAISLEGNAIIQIDNLIVKNAFNKAYELIDQKEKDPQRQQQLRQEVKQIEEDVKKGLFSKVKDSLSKFTPWLRDMTTDVIAKAVKEYISG